MNESQPLSSAGKENQIKGKKIHSREEVKRKEREACLQITQEHGLGGVATGIPERKTKLFGRGRTASQVIQTQCLASCQHSSTETIRSHTLRAYDTLFPDVGKQLYRRMRKRRRQWEVLHKRFQFLIAGSTEDSPFFDDLWDLIFPLP